MWKRRLSGPAGALLLLGLLSCSSAGEVPVASVHGALRILPGAASDRKDSADASVRTAEGKGDGAEPTLLQSHPAADSESSEDPVAAEYRRLNDEEPRYAGYKDSEQMLKLKLDQLAYINASRERYGAPAVRLDILASRVANRMAQEACAEDFRGHWNTRGEKPYHRYAFAGGVDHVSENASALWSSAPVSRTPITYLQNMRNAHDRFMAEKPPNDGHKRNCIAEQHNYVGLGVWIEGTQFRYYEEYIDRYLTFLQAPTEATARETALIVVRAIDPLFYVYALSAFYEPAPTPMTPDQINRKGSYSDYTNDRVLSLWPWELDDFREGETFRIPLSFDKKGLYYVQMYLSDRPYSLTSASTSGKIQASGLVIRVR